MSSRRGVGLSAFQNRSSLTSSYASHGANLRSSHLSSLQTQLSVFRSLLHNFALQHADEIKSNPTFRAEFARMCNAIGVDPLAGSNAKGKGGGGGAAKGIGSWLGAAIGGGSGSGVNEFYFQIAVRVVEVCRSSRGENGGLIGLDECRARVAKGRGLGGEIEVGKDDLVRAVEALLPLGSGFAIVTVGHQQLIRSVPKELSTDQAKVLEAIQVLGYVTCAMLEDNMGWDQARSETVIEDLAGASLLWVDYQACEHEYWSPAFLNDFDE